MRAVGLITEYNPFHNGHLHHLEESRRLAGADVAVAVMSGHFLQRGEAALVDKWTRAEMALTAGVDVVVELPYPWACNSAPHFALGAVRTLDALGGIDALCFGSESGDIAQLSACADLLCDRGEEIDEKTSAFLRRGVSYPAARSAVCEGMIGPQVGLTLQAPNNILGIEYLKALRQTGSRIAPITTPRIGAGYHDLRSVGRIASATGIRAMIAEKEAFSPYLPRKILPTLHRAIESGRTADPEAFFRLLLSRIFAGRDALTGLYLVEDGIEARIAEAADRVKSIEEMTNAVKSRHWTRTRIQRLFCALVNNVTEAEMSDFLSAPPPYLHLLGHSERGRRFLAQTRKKRLSPLIGNYSRIHARLKRFYGAESQRYTTALRILELELRATRNYTLLMKGWVGESRNRDFYEEVRTTGEA